MIKTSWIYDVQHDVRSEVKSFNMQYLEWDIKSLVTFSSEVLTNNLKLMSAQ